MSYIDDNAAISCAAADLVDLGAQNVNLLDNTTVHAENGLMCGTGVAAPTTPQYGFATEHATQTSAENHTYTRPDLLKAIQGADGTVDQTIKKAFVNPQTALITSANFSEGLTSDQRMCGVGQFAQIAPPGTVIPRSYANPQVSFPEADANGDLNPADFPEGYFSWGGTLVVYRRGEGALSADVNGVADDNSDLACYKVPECPQETIDAGGRCFCLGMDFTNGYPPTKDWKQIKPCLEKVRCPGFDASTGAFDETLVDAETADGGLVMWQFGSTEAFQGVPNAKEVADRLEYKHGYCNPMGQTEVLAATQFTERGSVQADDISTLRDELSLEPGEIIPALEFTVEDDAGNSLNCKFKNAVDNANVGTGYAGSWVVDEGTSTLATFTSAEATDECTQLGYNSCGYQQYVNEGLGADNTVTDGSVCSDLGESGAACTNYDILLNNVKTQCAPDFENAGACGVCDNDILPISAKVAPKFAQITTYNGAAAAPAPEDPRSCRFARFFFEGENATLASGQTCGDLGFTASADIVPSTAISNYDGTERRACYSYDTANSNFNFPLYTNQTECDAATGGTCSSSTVNGTSFFSPAYNTNAGVAAIPNLDANKTGVAACDANSYVQAQNLVTEPVTSTSNCFAYGSDGTNGTGFYYPSFADQTTCEAFAPSSFSACTESTINGAQYWLPSAGADLAKAQFGSSLPPTVAEGRFACTTDAFAQAFSSRASYAARAADRDDFNAGGGF
jgi:hypothetical protein